MNATDVAPAGATILRVHLGVTALTGVYAYADSVSVVKLTVPLIPGAPTVTVTPGVSLIKLNWTYCFVCDGFIVSRSVTPGTETPIGVSTAPVYWDQTAVPGVTYYYTVTGAGWGLGPASAEVSGTPASTGFSDTPLHVVDPNFTGLLSPWFGVHSASGCSVTLGDTTWNGQPAGHWSNSPTVLVSSPSPCAAWQRIAGNYCTLNPARYCTDPNAQPAGDLVMNVTENVTLQTLGDTGMIEINVSSAQIEYPLWTCVGGPLPTSLAGTVQNIQLDCPVLSDIGGFEITVRNLGLGPGEFRARGVAVGVIS